MDDIAIDYEMLTPDEFLAKYDDNRDAFYRCEFYRKELKDIQETKGENK